MGVPSFFSWLLRNFKENKIILKKLNDKIVYLYLDANCLFHPECAKIKEYYITEMDNDKLEQKMFKRIENYLNYIEYFVNPTNTLYISVDGVAPLAKMCQQRKRRFKSVDETKIKNELKAKYKISYSEAWNNTCITPGTEFMERLHNFLIHNYEIKNKNKKTNIKYIYSSYHSIGEGEHKILQHIKNNKELKDDIIVIYGLDADLIFLAMASEKSNIFLLREAIHLGYKSVESELYDPVTDVAQELMYVSIDETKKSINKQIWKIIESRPDIKNKIKIERTIDFSKDFIFICFLLGNDFLPHFPSIDIYSGGLDEIIHSYIECISITNQLIIEINENKVRINQIMFILLVENLGKKEEKYFKETLPKKIYQHYKRTYPSYINSDYEKELWDLDNMMNIKKDDPIRLGEGDAYNWKFRYYEYYFHVSEHQEEFKNEIIRLYLEGIIWVTKYYFEECTEWRYQFPYDHAPFISDIARYMRHIKIDINNIEFAMNGPVPMMVQLISVLPPVCNKLLPKSYRKLVTSNESPIIDMYPIKTELDILYKFQYWQCIPKMPYLDINRILKICEKHKLTKDENNRQKILDKFIY